MSRRCISFFWLCWFPVLACFSSSAGRPSSENDAAVPQQKAPDAEPLAVQQVACRGMLADVTFFEPKYQLCSCRVVLAPEATAGPRVIAVHPAREDMAVTITNLSESLTGDGAWSFDWACTEQGLMGLSWNDSPAEFAVTLRDHSGVESTRLLVLRPAAREEIVQLGRVGVPSVYERRWTGAWCRGWRGDGNEDNKHCTHRGFLPRLNDGTPLFRNDQQLLLSYDVETGPHTQVHAIGTTLTLWVEPLNDRLLCYLGGFAPPDEHVIFGFSTYTQEVDPNSATTIEMAAFDRMGRIGSSPYDSHVSASSLENCALKNVFPIDAPEESLPRDDADIELALRHWLEETRVQARYQLNTGFGAPVTGEVSFFVSSHSLEEALGTRVETDERGELRQVTFTNLLDEPLAYGELRLTLFCTDHRSDARFTYWYPEPTEGGTVVEHRPLEPRETVAIGSDLLAEKMREESLLCPSQTWQVEMFFDPTEVYGTFWVSRQPPETFRLALD